MDNAKRNARIVFGCWIVMILLLLIGIFTKIYLLIFIGIGLFFVYRFFLSKTQEAITNETLEKVEKIFNYNNFSYIKKAISYDELNGIAINDKQFAYISRNDFRDEFSIKSFDFKDIIEAKIITDKQILTSTSVSSSVARGVVGGLIFGGVGAIIGGSTANTNSVERFKELTLEIVVNDLMTPRYILTFYKNKPLEKSNPIIQEIEEWYRTFSVIINQNKREVRSV